MNPWSVRRYRVLSVVGRGGFGTVYRANLETPDGFNKPVALKVLRGSKTDADVDARFRDEARILGLARDRAIVGVDLPTRVLGRDAVVMEYVVGQSVANLIDHDIPALAAVDMVAEIARALHALWNQPGPDGAPLHLMHRDLKPSNLLLTPTGDVKILDMGSARATFVGREAHSTMSVSGTPGYIAPERWDGVEGPEGDIYSLGAVLWGCVAARVHPTWSDASGASKERGLQEAVELSAWMRQPSPDRRPTADEVMRRCREILREDGRPLQDWCATHVREQPGDHDDPWVGRLLTEDAAMPRGVPMLQLAAAFLIGAVGMGALPAASVPVDTRIPVVDHAPAESSTLQGSVEFAPPVQTHTPAVVAVPSAPETVPMPKAIAMPRPEVVQKVERRALMTPPASRARAIPDVVPEPAVPVVEETVTAEKLEPVSASSLDVQVGTVSVGSIPPGARTWVDGAELPTPVIARSLPEGVHEIRMVFGDQQAVRQIDVSADTSMRYLWVVEDDRWKVHGW